ncbi:MAG: hypothetical protein ABFD49_05380 [Armatimonadota bacterium]|nr:hypothetical protein [bacterium]
MFNFDWYKNHLQDAVGIISDYVKVRSQIACNTNYSQEFRDKKLSDLSDRTSNSLNTAFVDICDQVSYEVTRAVKKAAPPSVDPAERSYQALAASQDTAARNDDPVMLLRLYEQAAENGEKTRQTELERLLDPVFADSQHFAAWEDMKAKYRTPEESEALTMKTLAPRLLEMLQAQKSYIMTTFYDAQTGTSEEQVQGALDVIPTSFSTVVRNLGGSLLN